MSEVSNVASCMQSVRLSRCTEAKEFTPPIDRLIDNVAPLIQSITAVEKLEIT